MQLTGVSSGIHFIHIYKVLHFETEIFATTYQLMFPYQKLKEKQTCSGSLVIMNLIDWLIYFSNIQKIVAIS